MPTLSGLAVVPGGSWDMGGKALEQDAAWGASLGSLLSHTPPSPGNVEPIPRLCPVQLDNRESSRARRTEEREGASVRSQTWTCRTLAVGHSARPALYLRIFHLYF